MVFLIYNKARVELPLLYIMLDHEMIGTTVIIFMSLSLSSSLSAMSFGL